MAPRFLSWWFNSRSQRNRSKNADRIASARRPIGRRMLRLEPLEGRQLLSVSAAAPAISLVTPSTADSLISWNVADDDGVASTSLSIDGVAVKSVYGPYAASSGFNYAGLYNQLAAGAHDFVITATDKFGDTTDYTGSFSIDNAGPSIGQIAQSTAEGILTWNTADADGIRSASITLDGNAITNIWGPFTAASGVNYAAVIGKPSIGTHSYVITSTDNAGNVSRYTGTFDATTNGPTISGVVASTSQGVLSWNAADFRGVASCGLTVDGVPVTNISGPFSASLGSNYCWYFNAMGAGTHSYTITATEGQGNATRHNGTFDVGTNSGPQISQVSLSPSDNTITWNVLATNGVASSSLTIDSSSVSSVYGPYSAASGKNFAAVYDSLSAGEHKYTITATDGASKVWYYTGTFIVGNTLPQISGVVIASDSNTITWNVVDSDGVSTSSLVIDGETASSIYGPYAAGSGSNYAGVFSTLTAGTHTYTLTVTDTAGYSSKSVGLFSVTGPVISSVVAVPGNNLITWNAAATSGIASTALWIDDKSISNISGPYVCSPGVNYAGAYDTLTAGSHTYKLRATDGAGRTTQITGTFEVVGPTVSHVVASDSERVITWTVAATYGVASSTITIDSGTISAIYGPYAGSGGVNYSAIYKEGLLTGQHTYEITSTDGAGNIAKYSGNFMVG